MPNAGNSLRFAAEGYAGGTQTYRQPPSFWSQNQGGGEGGYRAQGSRSLAQGSQANLLNPSINWAGYDLDSSYADYSDDYGPSAFPMSYDNGPDRSMDYGGGMSYGGGYDDSGYDFGEDGGGYDDFGYSDYY
jgi:hypothetical protein